MAQKKVGLPSTSSNTRELTEAELTDLAKNLSPDEYLLLGIRLGFTKARLDQIKHNHPGDIVGTMASMLIHWKNNRSGGTLFHRKKLSEALTHIDRSDLSTLLNRTDDNQSSSQSACTKHPTQSMTHFCKYCMTKACGNCVSTIHKGHRATPLTENQAELAKMFEEKQRTAENIITRVAKLKTTSEGQKLDSNVSLDSITECIEQTSTAAITSLCRQKSQLLKELRTLESVGNGEILNQICLRFAQYTSALGGENASVLYYNDMEKFENAMKVIDTVREAVVDKRVLSNMESINIFFTPRREVILGHLEATGWYFEKIINLPEDKTGFMNAVISLNETRVGVGYSTGGVDVICTKSKAIMRIATDVRVRSLLKLNGGRLVIGNTSGTLFVYLEGGARLASSFKTRKYEKHFSLSSDGNDNIYIGYSDLKEIDVFSPSGGSAIRIIKTSVEPWFMCVVEQSGNIVLAHCAVRGKEGVQVMTQEGKELSRISGIAGHAVYSTCDVEGNIYIALKTEDGQTTIRKYSEKGEYLETVAKELHLVMMKYRQWLQLSCLSSTKLVACDQEAMYICHKHRILNDLMQLAI